jgi:hypothetical protein
VHADILGRKPAWHLQSAELVFTNWNQIVSPTAPQSLNLQNRGNKQGMVCTPVILATQEMKDHEFEPCLGYIPRHYLKKTKTKTKTR